MTDIRKLAEYLGLSVGTVSRALNDRPEVNRETRERVLAAAHRVGYVPNQAGRSLRQGSTQMFGFVFGQSGTDGPADAGSFLGVVAAIQRELARHKLDLVVFPGSEEEDLGRYVRRLARRHIVDGIVVAEAEAEDGRIRYICESDISFETFGDGRDGTDRSYVEIDLDSAVKEGVRRFCRGGHRKIALVSGSANRKCSQVHLREFRRQMEHHGLEARAETMFACSDDAAAGYFTARQIAGMRDRPTAIVCFGRDVVTGLYRGLQEAGCWPGRDIAVVGAISAGEESTLLPKLSGFKLDLPGLGRAIAARLLAGRGDYTAFYEPQPAQLIWPLTYVAGESDAFAPHTRAAS